MRVLIVEDTPDEAELFADLVAHHGHDPIVAASAEAALDSLATAAPDAVLLDMYLPGMSGLELLRVLSERPQRCPVVVISGVATEEQARRCLEAQLLIRRFTGEMQGVNRRRYARAKVSLDVMVEEPAGRQWEAQAVDLSPFGVKLRAAGAVPPGATARLSFTPPDGDKRITVLALMVRKDPDGQAYAFINLTNADFTRLKNFVDAGLLACLSG